MKRKYQNDNFSGKKIINWEVKYFSCYSISHETFTTKALNTYIYMKTTFKILKIEKCINVNLLRHEHATITVCYSSRANIQVSSISKAITRVPKLQNRCGCRMCKSLKIRLEQGLYIYGFSINPALSRAISYFPYFQMAYSSQTRRSRAREPHVKYELLKDRCPRTKGDARLDS